MSMNVVRAHKKLVLCSSSASLILPRNTELFKDPLMNGDPDGSLQIRRFNADVFRAGTGGGLY